MQDARDNHQPPFAPESPKDASAETVELDRIARHVGELLQGNAPIDREGSRQRCHDVLRELGSCCEKSTRLRHRIASAVTVVGGSEHLLIRLPDEPERFFKATFDDNFGCKTEFFESDPELTGRHFHASGNADPIAYLWRWIYLNSIGRYQTRYEGILPPAKPGQLPRICVSQAVLPAVNPTDDQVKHALSKYGFARICTEAFLHEDSGILLTDLHPRNIRIVDGEPVPFDAIAEFASERVLEWWRKRRDP